MSRFRKIDTRIWNDAKFRGLSDGGKLTFLMLLTHPNMTSLGAFRATVAGLAEELGWTVEAFRKAFGEALANGMAEHDASACYIGLPNFVKFNQPESPNVVLAWAASLDLIPECEAKTAQIQRARGWLTGRAAFLEAFDKAFGKGFAAPSPNPEQEPEQDPEKTRARATVIPIPKASGGRKRTVVEAARDRLAEIGGRS